ncbi:HAD family hydrolase [Azorhizobium sp. AG788]|uniref:D-glycero-alpha-D-manno-heptose-1,7-bisphosphate 7-phosphatase n=1 Tax=Azorhizobium sp. AG788 TaxID=2183897 RepID=UPI003138CC17
MAPAQAVIPWGFDADASAPLPPLGRLLADCGRFGLTRSVLLVPTGRAARAQEALAELSQVAPLPDVRLVEVRAPHAPAALSEIKSLLDAHFALFDPAIVLDGNWLNLVPKLADADDALALVPGTGPFALINGRAAARTDDGAPGFMAMAVAMLRRDALMPAAAAPNIPAMLLQLTQDTSVAACVFAGSQILPACDGLPVRPPRPALFLDRDGTLNEDYGYVSDPDRLVLLPGAAAAVKRANDLGWYVFLVTNQSGVGRGYYEEAQVLLCNATLQDQLRARGAHLDDIRYAPDHPEALLPRYRSTSDWRKPGPGMLIDLMAHWPVRREASLMVGDKASDVDAGTAAGIRSLLFSGGDLDTFLAPHLQPVIAP